MAIALGAVTAAVAAAAVAWGWASIVGTYIAAVVPLVIAFMSVGMPETLILLIYLLIYQPTELPRPRRPRPRSRASARRAAPPSTRP